MWKKCLFKPDDLASANGYISYLASSTSYFQAQLASATGYMPWKSCTLLFFCYACLEPYPKKLPLAQLASQTG